MELLAAVFREVGAPLLIECITLDPPGATEVLVRIAAVGLCRTDYHVVRGERRVAMRPMVLGHEAAGVVEQIGTRSPASLPAITSFSPSSRPAASATGAGKVCIISAPRLRASRKARSSTAATAGATASAPRSAPSA
jgi:alcohol dehydrogenase/S-(hydroxymethyl)glutathione dehydrogenase/alcohol dehydrogenase